MTNGPWRVYVVDDDRPMSETIGELVVPAARNEAGQPPDIECEQSFEKAMSVLETRDFDLLILDVRNQAMEASAPDADSDLGKQVYRDVRSRRFVPIVFYTALPAQVEQLANPPFVQVVSKISDNHVHELREAVSAAFDSGFPRLHRALTGRVESTARNFMIDFVEKNWEELRDHKADVAHLLMRRLGISLERGGTELATELGLPTEQGSKETVHPTRFMSPFPPAITRRVTFSMGRMPDTWTLREERTHTGTSFSRPPVTLCPVGKRRIMSYLRDVCRWTASRSIDSG